MRSPIITPPTTNNQQQTTTNNQQILSCFSPKKKYATLKERRINFDSSKDFLEDIPIAGSG
ncbi:hypothetical protein [Fischerella thermalis]|uniref:hypothetical protein n=1 Tax=Fischerella thermalis TaxID=372787 RepID=UPI00307D7DB7